jgi:streptomycin 6-kinase
VSGITIPPELAHAVDEDDLPERFQWLADLPAVIAETAAQWRLELGEPYLPGGQCAWVAPARGRRGEDLVLKAHWRHPEAEHEADALRFWDGNGAVRCFATKTLDHTTLLLLERCDPGMPLSTRPEPEQDIVISDLLGRLWEQTAEDGHPFVSLQDMCDIWADHVEQEFEGHPRGFDPGLVRDGVAVMRELPKSADRAVLLCTDLHAGNVLSARREPWLVIDPKPFIGDPAFDPVQHMFNCEERLAADPVGLSERMAELAGVDPARVRLWLFARAVQEFHSPEMRELAGRLASSTP